VPALCLLLGACHNRLVGSPAATAAFPERVGPYELLVPIASGGMGTVYLARKRGAGGFEREVALKLTHAFLRDDPDWATQLIEEAKLAGLVRHPNVVQVLDVEDDPNGVFLVMEYVEGSTLGGLMRQAQRQASPMPPAIALRILVDALAGLHAAHELRDTQGRPMGLVHRDFTPQNILVGTDGVSRLTDFGVAKASSRMSATRTGVVKGKASYMSPEQVRAQPLDRRADIWAAGVVAWEAFAGRKMREAIEDQAALLLRVAHEEAPRLRSVVPSAPPAVDDAIASALTLDRTRRCPTAQRFSEVLVRAWSSAAQPSTPAEVAEYVGHLEGRAVSDRRERARMAAQQRIVAAATGPASSSSRATPSPPSRGLRMAIVAGGTAIAIAAAVAMVRAEWARAHRAAAADPSLPVPSALRSPTRSLHVEANAPVTELRVDGALIVLSAPADRLSVEVPSVLHAGIGVSGSSIDGREATATLGDDPGSVTLVFPPPALEAPVNVDAPAASTTARARGHGTRPPPHGSPSAPAASSDVPLAQSPYEKP
jgi:serine/threonine protein kinase